MATGTLAVLAVATLVITITPRTSTGPVALSSTTLPAAAQTIRSAVSTASTATTTEVQAGVVALANSIRTARIDDFTAIPTAIASVPSGVVDRGGALADIATELIAANDVMLPDLTDDVTVISRDFIYAVQWRDVAHLTEIDDAAVVTSDGAVIAVITDGRLVVASDSYGTNVATPVGVSVQVDTADRVSLDD